jgi:7,8-dihydropterin-6-yl-methyl-4-(beta-D-ribofuranosyl)aminobenzene 5'-phosphate synthase
MTAAVTCVVDNKTLKEKSLKKEHGLAFWIETEHGTVLFDTGQKGKVLMHNLTLLDLNPRDVDVLAISHSHFDHTGGLGAVIRENPALTMVANEEIFQPRYSRRKGKYEGSGFEMTQEDLAKKIKIRLSSAPNEIFPNLWTTGEITRRTEPEGRSSSHFVRVGEEWIPDPYRDDMSLVLKTVDGLVVICGCCHAGILNTLSHIKDHFEGVITAVMGGIHLMTADKKMLDNVIHKLGERFPELAMYLNHCTGDDAIKALKAAFGECVHSFPAGSVVTFDDLIT